MNPEPQSIAPPLLIGVPVYNGAGGLARGLESLLTQSSGDFDLLISDNGSTDETPRIAAAFAQQDRRVRVIRSPANQGPTWNFNRLLEEAQRYRYFMWAAHDDVWSPNYVASCLQALELQPGLVLCGTQTRFVDPKGHATSEVDQGVTTIGLNRGSRAVRYLEAVGRNSIFYGIYRTSAIEGRRLRNHIGGDQLFLFELSLVGEFLTLPDLLFTRQSGGVSRTAADIYRALGARPLLGARFLRIDVYRGCLEAVSAFPLLGQAERRRLRGRIISTGLKRHVLGNLSPRRFLWWLRHAGTNEVRPASRSGD